MKKIILLFFAFILNFTFLQAKDARSIIEEAVQEFINSNTSDAANLGQHFTDKYIDMDAVTTLVIAKKMRDALQKVMPTVKKDIEKRVAYTLGQKLKAGKNAAITVKKDVRSARDPILKKTLTVVSVVIDSKEYGKINVDLYVDEKTGRIATAKIDGTFDLTKTFKDDYQGLWKMSNENPDTFIAKLLS